MESNWYIEADGQTYGPYTWEQMHTMTLTGQIIPESMIYHEELGDWVKASTIKELGLETAPETYDARPQNTLTQQPKKKKGCLKGCLITFGIFIIAVALVVILVMKPESENEMMKLGKAKVVSETTVDVAGDTIVVNDVNSDIDGLSIEVPEGAYDSATKFEVSTKEIKKHEFGDNFNPILPLIHVDNGGDMSNQVMTLTVPINIDDSMFAMASYYNDDGTLEPITMISQTNNEMILGVTHFSDVAITAVPKVILDKYIGAPSHDSGFRPGVDNWSFANHGSELSPGGICAGMTLSAIYYYTYHTLNGEEPLYTYLDNNHYINSEDLWKDDSMGVRLASIVQKGIDWRGYQDWSYEYVHKTKFLTDKNVFYHFAYAFLLTNGAPQGVGMKVRSEVDGIGKIKRGGHAIIAYGMDHNGLYVCDPNFPERTDLFIPFDGENFGVYKTSLQVDAATSNYNSFSLHGLSSIYPTGKIEELFEEATKNPYESTIGNGDFSDAYYKALIIVENTVITVGDVEVIEFLPEESAIYKATISDYRSNNSNKSWMPEPSDWSTKPYIVYFIKVNQAGSAVQLFTGNDENPIVSTRLDDNGVFFYIPLEEGSNNVGVCFFKKFTNTNSDGIITDSFKFIEFNRSNIFYGEEDLTGTWKGEFQITEYEQAMDYAEGIAMQISKGLTKVLSGMFGQDLSDAEIQEIAESSIEVNEQLTDPMPITMVLSNKVGQTYEAKITIETDAIYDYETEVTYDGYKVNWSVTAEDGARLNFSYDLYDNMTLSGEFDIEYGTVNDFVEGISDLKKEE